MNGQIKYVATQMNLNNFLNDSFLQYSFEIHYTALSSKAHLKEVIPGNASGKRLISDPTDLK